MSHLGAQSPGVRTLLPRSTHYVTAGLQLAISLLHLYPNPLQLLALNVITSSCQQFMPLS